MRASPGFTKVPATCPELLTAAAALLVARFWPRFVADVTWIVVVWETGSVTMVVFAHGFSAVEKDPGLSVSVIGSRC